MTKTQPMDNKKEAINLLNVFFTSGATHIKQVAHSQLHKLKRTDLIDDLIAETYIYLNELLLSPQHQTTRHNLVLTQNIDYIDSILVNYMQKQIIWSNTKFKRNNIWTNYSKPLYQSTTLSSDFSITNQNITTTTDDEDILEYEKNHQDKLTHIAATIPTLPIEQQILFNLIYNQGHTTAAAISKQTGLSRTQSHYLITKLKEDIRAGYN